MENIYHRLIRMETLKQRAEHFYVKYFSHNDHGTKTIRSMSFRAANKANEDFLIKPVDFNDVIEKNKDLGSSSSQSVSETI